MEVPHTAGVVVGGKVPFGVAGGPARVQDELAAGRMRMLARR